MRKKPKKQPEIVNKIVWLLIDTFTIHTLGNFFATTYNLPEISWLTAFIISCLVAVYTELWI